MPLCLGVLKSRWPGRDDIPVMTLDRTIDTVIDEEYMVIPLVADIVGDRGTELLLPTLRDMRIHDASGRPPWLKRCERLTR